jgi:hypothetical protein
MWLRYGPIIKQICSFAKHCLRIASESLDEPSPPYMVEPCEDSDHFTPTSLKQLGCKVVGKDRQSEEPHAGV